jgi:hypothetical protein
MLMPNWLPSSLFFRFLFRWMICVDILFIDNFRNHFNIFAFRRCALFPFLFQTSISELSIATMRNDLWISYGSIVILCISWMFEWIADFSVFESIEVSTALAWNLWLTNFIEWFHAVSQLSGTRNRALVDIDWTFVQSDRIHAWSELTISIFGWFLWSAFCIQVIVNLWNNFLHWRYLAILQFILQKSKSQKVTGINIWGIKGINGMDNVFWGKFVHYLRPIVTHRIIHMKCKIRSVSGEHIEGIVVNRRVNLVEKIILIIFHAFRQDVKNNNTS